MITSSINPFEDLLLFPEFLFESLFQEESLLHFTVVTQVFQEENKTIKESQL